MRYLLDTHTFIWWDSQPAQLFSRVLALCQDSKNSLVLSVVTVWEIQIKHQTGKLALHMPLISLIEAQIKTNRIELLSIQLPHVFALNQLPNAHKDPFDRLLVAQAVSDGIPILSNDAIFAQYPATVIW